ncbi:MAG: BatD family protein [Candidatus Omnitrophica bacterium]|nr:BatD family protein [Candidatus Omnitrophota bacterium]
MRLTKLVILVFGLFLLLGAGESGQIVKATVNKNKVSTGELLIYTVTIEGIFKDPQVTPPEFKDFKVSSQSNSQNYYFSGSGTKINITLIYTLLALKAGNFSLGPTVIKDEGEEYKSNVVDIAVEGKPFKEKKKILPYIDEGLEI